MSDDRKVIAPRAETPTPRAHDGRVSSTRLPDDLVSDQVQRLALFSGIAAALWGNGLVMDTILMPLAVPGTIVSPISSAIEIAAIVANIATCIYVRRTRHPLQKKVDAGLVLMWLNAVLIAALNTWSQESLMHVTMPSWATMVILVFSMIVPTTPRRMLIASLAAASMDTVAYGIASLRGLQTPPAAVVCIAAIPNFACALIAVVPALLLQGVGRRLREARDLGSYQLIERLGEGGMGEVWRAEHHLLARKAAIKLVRPEMLGAANDAARLVLRRFEREAQATAALSSPHTINLFDFGITDEGTFYYVMELLEGRDLESLVKQFGPVGADRAIFLLRQVCHSLADAHVRGLVHRDIKPANIYLCRMGLEYDFVKVLDFGLVKNRGRGDQQLTLTATHTTTGTPAYMAPEIILGESDVDCRADVYSLGCVAYYLLTGHLVFEGDTPMKMLLQHVQTAPVAPSLRSELEISPELDNLVLACLEKDPNKRPQNAEQLFRRACRCKTGDSWDQDQARAWWERHLPELTGPLTLGERSAGAANSVFAAN
jgi:eukaryotic-like serine/threonine-protein kinase